MGKLAKPLVLETRDFEGSTPSSRTIVKEDFMFKEKERLEKLIAELKLSRTSLIKGKHASPMDLIKLLNIADTKIERHQLELKKLGE